MPWNKAQISAEALFAVAVVLAMGLVVTVFTTQKNSESSDLFASFSEKSECEMLSSIIYSVSSSSASPAVVFDLELNASISKGSIFLEEYYCDFLGNASDANLSAGSFKALKNSQGVVVFERLA